ncbi:MAG: FAD-dependent monooxygenase [Gemmatimonadota bacterium]
MILIVGAGPTGLVLALWLARRGVACRIIDKAPDAGSTSRALVLHARTLEFYRQLGIADGVVRESLPFAGINLWVRGTRRAHLELGPIGIGLTPYPMVLIFPQDEHERFLVHRLAETGVTVERPVELVSYREHGDVVTAELRHGDGQLETVDASHLVGCDGAHSAVRAGLGVDFPGGTYSHLFYVADVVASGPMVDKELHVAIDNADFVAGFPLAGPGAVRVVGTIAPEAERTGETLSWDDVSAGVLQRMQLVVEQVNWFSTYRVHHRVASSWRRGRVFIAGDAAHIHSPVGGQGMNTGIGDAVNLAWKLADVLQGRDDDALLASYEAERIGFARRLVNTTDRAFAFVTRDGLLAKFVRRVAMPWLAPWLTRFGVSRRFVFRTLSQTAINYRGIGSNRGSAGTIVGGDRLPWVPPRAAGMPDNFVPLASLDWQVHLHGEADAAISAACERAGLPLHRFAWSSAADHAGYQRGAAYLVRPDGYVGVAGWTDEKEER